MPTYTTLLGLEKPLPPEQYNIAVFNNNSDLIDRAIINNTYRTSGSANSYTITPTPAIGGYVTGMRFMVEFHVANTSTVVNININGRGNRRIFLTGTSTGIEPVSGYISANSKWLIEYNGTSFNLINSIDILSNIAQNIVNTLPYHRLLAMIVTSMSYSYEQLQIVRPFLMSYTEYSASTSISVVANGHYVVVVVGGGGAGAQGGLTEYRESETSFYNSPGGGGAGGAIRVHYYTPTANVNIAITVGSGGVVGSTRTNSTAGGTSSFGNIVTAQGGNAANREIGGSSNQGSKGGSAINFPLAVGPRFIPGQYGIGIPSVACITTPGETSITGQMKLNNPATVSLTSLSMTFNVPGATGGGGYTSRATVPRIGWGGDGGNLTNTELAQAGSPGIVIVMRIA